MNIAIGSAFRNSSSRLRFYFQRVAKLQEHAGKNNYVRVIAVEGDSTDDTRERLTSVARSYGVPVDVHVCNHHGPVYGSTEEPARMKALSKVGNAILAGVDTDLDDVLVYIESDLLWTPHDIGSLIDMAYEKRGGYDIFAPMVYSSPGIFYDIWAFRKNGQRFSPFRPYHSGLQGVTELDSAGSCLVMRSEVAADVQMNEGALVEWCDNARAQGYKIAVHPHFKVNHP